MTTGDYYTVGSDLHSRKHKRIYTCKSESVANDVAKRMNDATAKYYKGKRARTEGGR